MNTYSALTHALKQEQKMDDTVYNATYDHDVYDFEQGEVFDNGKQYFQEKVRVDQDTYSLLKLVYTDDNGDYTLNVFIKANDEHVPLNVSLSMKDVMDALFIYDTGVYDMIEVYLNCKIPDTTTFHIKHVLSLYDNPNETYNQTYVYIKYIDYESTIPARLDIGSFLGDIDTQKQFTLVMDNVALIDADPSREETTDRIRSVDADIDYDDQLICKYFGWNDIRYESEQE